MSVIVPVMGLVIMLVSISIRVGIRISVLSNSGLQLCGEPNITPAKLGDSLYISQILCKPMLFLVYESVGEDLLVRQTA